MKSSFIKPWEVVLAALIVFLACSTSLYWYDRFSKYRKHSVEIEMRTNWEQETNKWQKDATDNVNALIKSQREVLTVLNANFEAGRLIIPQKEKK
jgi:uncharacterized ion transporter superfamily protein YfcC